MSTTTKKTNVAVIGYGLSAKIFHIPLILALPDLYTLYGVVQRTPKPDDDASKDHPGIKSFRSVDDMLQDPAIYLVVVSSLAATHFTFAKQALEAGKHLVVEKPFVPTSAEARQLHSLAKEKGLLLSVYQNRRWDVDFLTLKQVLAEGVLGDIAEFETHYDRFRPDNQKPVAPGAGVLYDLGTHLIDQVYALYGPSKSVYGIVQVQKRGLKIGDVAPDACTVLLRYGATEDEEMLVTVKSSSFSACGEQLRYLIRGEKGSFRKYDLDPQEVQLLSGLRPGDKDFGRDPPSSHGTLTVPDPSIPQGRKVNSFVTKTYPSVEPTTYVEYYRVLADALAGKGEVPVGADQAADVLRIIEMAIESSQTGKVLLWEGGEDGTKATMI